MAAPFRLSWEIYARANSGSLTKLNQDVRGALKDVRGDVNVVVSPQSISTLDALHRTLEKLNSTLKVVGTGSRRASNDVEQVGRSVRSSASSASDAADSFGKFANQVGYITQRLSAYGLAAAVVYKLTGAFKDGIREAIEFQDEMIKLGQVSGASASQLKQVENSILGTSSKLGVSAQELARVSVQFRQAGNSMKDIPGLLDDIAKASLSPAFGSLETAFNVSNTAAKQFNLTAAQTKQVLNEVNGVSKEFSVNAADIQQAMEHTGTVFREAGGNVEELIALFTSVRSNTRESAGAISASLRTIFSNLQRQDTIDALKSLRINLRYTEEESKRIAGSSALTDQFVGPTEAVKRLSEALKNLPATDPRFAEVLEKIGGAREVEKALPLIRNFADAQRALNVQQASGLSLSLDAEKRQESLTNRIQKTKTEVLGLGLAMVESKGFQSFARGALDLADGLLKLTTYLKPLIPLLITISAIKLFKGLVSYFGEGQGAFAAVNKIAGKVGSAVTLPTKAKGYASGGHVPGHGDTDSVPAMLMPGEFVLNKQAVSKLGVGMLKAANRGELQGFASGSKDPVGQLTYQYRGLVGEVLKDLKKQFKEFGDVKELLKTSAEAYLQEAARTFKGGDFREHALGIIRQQTGDFAKKLIGAGVKDDIGAERKGEIAGTSRFQETITSRDIRRDNEDGNHSNALLGERRVEPSLDAKLALEKRQRVAVAAEDAEAVAKAQIDEKRPALAGDRGSLAKQGLARYKALRAGQQAAPLKIDASLAEPVLSPAQPSKPVAPAVGQLFASLGFDKQAAVDMTATFRRLTAVVENLNQAINATVGRAKSDAAIRNVVVKDADGNVVSRQEKRQIIKPQERIGYSGAPAPLLLEHKETADELLTRVASKQQEFYDGRNRGVAESLATESRAPRQPANKYDAKLERQYAELRAKRARQAEEDGSKKRGGDTADVYGLEENTNNRPYKLAPERQESLYEQKTREGVYDRRAREYAEQQQELNRQKSLKVIHEGDIFNYSNVSGTVHRLAPISRRLPTPVGIQATQALDASEIGQQSLNGRLGDKYSGGIPKFDPRLASPTYIDLDANRTRAAKAQATERSLGASEKYNPPPEFNATRKERERQERFVKNFGGKRYQTEYEENPADVPYEKADAVGYREQARAEANRILEENARRDAVRVASQARSQEQPLGSSRLGRVASAAGSLSRGALSGVNRVGNRFLSNGGIYALPLLAGAVEAAGQNDASLAAETGQHGSFKATKAVSGGLQGAAAGAVVGSAILPGYGTAIGAVVGGVAGVVSSLKESEKEIRNARIGLALQEFSAKLQDFVAGGGIATGEAAALSANYDRTRKDIRDKAADEATSYLGTSFNTKTYLTAEKRGFNDSYGPQRSQILQALDITARNVTKSSIGTGRDNKQITDEYVNSAAGLTRRNLQSEAEFKNVSFDDIKKEYAKKLADYSRGANADLSLDKSRESDTRTVYAFGRLTQAVEGAATGLLSLQNNTKTISELFEGRIGAAPVVGQDRAFGNIGGGDKSEFLAALGSTTTPLGGAGQGLRSAGEAADSVARVLPTILSKVVAENTPDEAAFSVRTRESLKQTLGYGDVADNKLPAEVRQVIESVVSKLSGTKLGEIKSETAIDSTKYTEKLLTDSVKPVQETLEKLGRGFAEGANRYIGGLAESRQRGAIIREGQDKLAGLQVGRFRTETEVAAENSGQRRNALDFVPLETLQYQYQQKQESLTGLRGPAATNPQGIASALRQAQLDAASAEKEQQAAFIKNGGGSNEFVAAADKLHSLQDRAVRFQQALENLTHVTERNAGVQEKLNKIEENRQGRLSFGERVLGAGPEELANINRGLLLINAGHQQGDHLNTFTPADRKLAFETLNSLGPDTKLTGIGGIKAGDLKERFITNTGGGFLGLDKEDAASKGQLQNERIDNAKAGEESQKLLVGNLTKVNDTLIAGLKEQQNGFFQRLEQLLVRDSLVRAQVELGKQSRDLSGLKGDKVGFDLLQKAGVTTPEQVQGLKQHLGDIETIATNNKLATELSEKKAKLLPEYKRDTANIVGYTNEDLNFNRFTDKGSNASHLEQGQVQKAEAYLKSKFGDILTPKQIGDAIDQFKNTGAYAARAATRDAGKSITPGGAPEEAKKALNDALLNSVLHVLGTEIVGANKNRDEAKQRLADAGLPADAIVKAASVNPSEFVKAINDFSKLENPITTFTERLNEATKAVDDLRGVVDGLTKQSNNAPQAPAQPPQAPQAPQAPQPLPPPPYLNPEGHAAGGPIFAPRGTDTVPAMLTPGEFVVKRDQAQKHPGLLHAINSGYMSGGGFVNYLADGGPANAYQERLNRRFDEDTGRQKLNEIREAHAREARERAEAKFKADDKADPIRRDIVGVNALTSAEAAKNSGGYSAQTTAGIAAINQATALEYARSKAGAKDSKELVQARIAAAGRTAAVTQGVYGYAGAASLANNAAHIGDAGAAFGLGRPGQEEQNQIGSTSYATAAKGDLAALTDSRTSPLYGVVAGQAIDEVKRRSRGFAAGGLVPGYGNGDVVKAALTPGEYVMNRSQVNKIGLGNVKRFAEGGSVGSDALNFGPPPSGGSDALNFGPSPKATKQKGGSDALDFGSSGGNTSELANALTTFVSGTKDLVSALTSFPKTISMEGKHSVEVIINGAEAMAKMAPAIQQIVTDQVNKAVGRIIKDKFPDVGGVE